MTESCVIAFAISTAAPILKVVPAGIGAAFCAASTALVVEVSQTETVVPMCRTATIQGRPDPREAWPQDKVAAFRANATGRALLIFKLCLGTGQRISDVLRMRWSDIEDGGINVQQGKTKAKLWIPRTPHLTGKLDSTPRIGMTICAWGPAGKPTAYRGAADLVMELRRKITACAIRPLPNSQQQGAATK